MRAKGSSSVAPLAALPAVAGSSTATKPTRTLAEIVRDAPAMQSSDAKSMAWSVDAFRPELAFTETLNFIPTEHQALGDAAARNELVTELRLNNGAALSFGDVVALSGDYVGSADELRQLAGTKEGRDQLAWARWTALSREGPEPDVSDETKRRVRDRNFSLTAENTSHFSHGGTAIATYERRHTEALRKAHEAGATGNAALFASAVTDEAACQHFLSDTFSAGHVRTPIIAIRDYYRREMPDALMKVFDYAARRVAKELTDRGDVPWYWPSAVFEKRVLETIESTAGKVVESFQLGDVVTLSCHNADGKGLNVVSDVDPSGTAIPGGYRWQAFGDGKLATGSINWDMAIAAMRASRAELDEARAMGAQGLKALPTPAAPKFIPRDDADRNPALAWRWGAMDQHMLAAVDACLREDLVDELRRNAPLPAIQHYTRSGQPDPRGSVTLHVGDAFEAFCHEVETDGIKVLERAIGVSALPA